MIQAGRRPKPDKAVRLKRKFIEDWQLYALVLLPLAYIFIFSYMPMYGLQIAFRNFQLNKGYLGSPWVGFKHFERFVNSAMFSRLIVNTVSLSLYQIIAGFFPPIILAICINECRRKFYKKTVQMITYIPHFLSTVVVVGIVMQLLSYSGTVNGFIKLFGGTPIDFLAKADWFKSIYVWSGVWQNVGYNSILYLAALTGISQETQEAAQVDGANIWQRIWNVDIPGIMPTAIILLILSTAGILNVGFEKVFLMQNTLNQRSSEIISTYIYKLGIVDMNYSFATAVNLFQSVITMVFMLTVNKIAGKVSETSLW